MAEKEKVETVKITVDVKTSKRSEKKHFDSMEDFEDWIEDFEERHDVSLRGSFEDDDEQDDEEEEEEEEEEDDDDPDDE